MGIVPSGASQASVIEVGVRRVTRKLAGPSSGGNTGKSVVGNGTAVSTVGSFNGLIFVGKVSLSG